MELTSLGIEGGWVAESAVWSDDRGFFCEWFKYSDILEKIGVKFSVQQANISISNKGVIRGIHYSIAPEGQAKWITCVAGSILDVIVDIRPSSPTYRQIKYVALKGGEGRAVLIGGGLGHGFISLEDNSAVSYLLSSPYAPEYELEINPMDSELKIDWHLSLIGGIGTVLSLKDAHAPSLGERELLRQLP